MVAQTRSDVQTCRTLLIRTASLRPINNLLLCQETKFPLNFHLWTRQVSALSSSLASLTQPHSHVVHAFWMLVLGPLPSSTPPGTCWRSWRTSQVTVPFSLFFLFSVVAFLSCAAHPCATTQGCKYLNQAAVESLPLFFLCQALQTFGLKRTFTYRSHARLHRVAGCIQRVGRQSGPAASLALVHLCSHTSSLLLIRCATTRPVKLARLRRL